MKTWIITGASSGIGKGIAKAVLDNGDQAIITARNAAKLEEFAAQYNGRAIPVSLEVTDKEQRKNVIERCIKEFGAIDVLVNNAGRSHHAAVEDSVDEDVRLEFETNYFGPVGMVQEALPYMRKQGSGLIINVSSMGVHDLGAVGNAFYVSSKIALDGFGMVLRNEVRPFGIKVMLVEPGTFRTNFRVGGIDVQGSKNSVYADTAYARDEYLKAHPFNQKGDPERAGVLIREAVYNDETPEILVLGSGMVELEAKALNARIKEVEKWKYLADQADFDN